MRYLTGHIGAMSLQISMAGCCLMASYHNSPRVLLSELTLAPNVMPTRPASLADQAGCKTGAGIESRIQHGIHQQPSGQQGV
jgi:hypothetical protein